MIGHARIKANCPHPNPGARITPHGTDKLPWGMDRETFPTEDGELKLEVSSKVNMIPAMFMTTRDSIFKIIAQGSQDHERDSASVRIARQDDALRTTLWAKVGCHFLLSNLSAS